MISCIKRLDDCPEILSMRGRTEGYGKNEGILETALLTITPAVTAPTSVRAVTPVIAAATIIPTTAV